MSKPPNSASKNSSNIYVGVGGWTFAPWRGVFYPEKLTQAKELEYAASKLTSIEINGTYSYTLNTHFKEQATRLRSLRPNDLWK